MNYVKLQSEFYDDRDKKKPLFVYRFHNLHKNTVFIDKCLQMKYENPNESEYIENA